MIAISIFGVGMLMVATTFPVGIDQARIVAEETQAPIIANEAFSALELLLDDPTPRIDADNNPTIPPSLSAGVPLLSFRQAIANIPISNALFDVFWNSNWGFNQPFLLLNDWLISPFASSSIREGGAQVRWYPSIPAATFPYSAAGRPANQTEARSNDRGQIPGFAAPRPPTPLYRWVFPQSNGDYTNPGYSWSALFMKTSLGNQPAVRFFVFVSRGSFVTPQRIQFGLPNWDTTGLSSPVAYAVIINAAQGLSPAGFSEDAYLVRGDGQIFQIKSVQVATKDDPAYLTFDRGPLVGAFSNDPVFWGVPADSSGRSPVIGIYQRTFLLD
mgnify:CR=1 FL=1